MRARQNERGSVQSWDDYLINCTFKGVVGIFLQCTPQLISNLLPWEEFLRTATSTHLRSHRLRGFGLLSGDWERRGGEGRGGWRKKRLPRKTLGAGNTAFMAISQTLRYITHERFTKTRKKETQKENKNKYKRGG